MQLLLLPALQLLAAISKFETSMFDLLISCLDDGSGHVFGGGDVGEVEEACPVGGAGGGGGGFIWREVGKDTNAG